jgi:Ca-activated chloride channel family protein
MRRLFLLGVVFLGFAASADARGLLVPDAKKTPSPVLLSQQVQVTIEDQAAVTRVEQVFRNATQSQFEATYVFPVARGAAVQKFTLWIDGKQVNAELVEAAKARKIYTELVQQTLDPALLEYIGTDLLRVRVGTVLPQKDIKVALQYTSVAAAEGGVIEYTYPLKSDGRTPPEKCSLTVHLKSQHALHNIYSPTHAVTLTRPSDREARVVCADNAAAADRDFKLFYQVGDKARDVGLTALTHRPAAARDGYFLFLLSPRAELARDQQIPRDFVFVIDTSGSMRGKRIAQARNALKYCLGNLEARDRFAIIEFAAKIRKYNDQLQPAEKGQLEKARKWVEQLEATSGTNINDALLAALAMRGNDEGRTFTVVFFTDGQPSVSETNPQIILQNVAAKNTASTRIFSFGVGDDVNASFLDQLAERTRGVSTYVREHEDIEASVSALYSKISNPVLANLKLTVGPDVKIAEVYPPQLPDLFRGNQLVVLGRYSGNGPTKIKLTGQVGKETREFEYELTFPAMTPDSRGFVEDLWARRKVGYLLDQIRINGEKKELVDEVTALAKRYGITTPYTSYLIVPDGRIPVAGGHFGYGGPQGLRPGTPGAPAPTVAAYAVKVAGDNKGDLGGNRARLEEERIKQVIADGKDQAVAKAFREAQAQKKSLDKARDLLDRRQLAGVQNGTVGVDLSVQSNQLRGQAHLCQTAVRRVQGRTCLDVGGVWIDDGFDAKMTTVTVKAMSKAYFRLLERQPHVREVLQLGNYLVWVTPSRTALAIDANHGVEELPDADIDRLFVPQQK